MIRHLFKFGFRSLKRHKGYVLINMMGLAIGLACSLMIGLFVIHELSFDQYHQDKDRIFRLGLHGYMGGEEVRAAYTAAPMGPTMAIEFPEVEGFLRMNIWDETIVQVEDRHYSLDHFAMVDSTFFDFFTISMVRGNPSTALTEPHFVVLTESVAHQLFGEEDPLDQMIRVGGMENHFRVTGIMEDIPVNTHFSAGMLGSFVTSNNANSTNWLSNNYATYVKLYPGTDPQTVRNRFEDMIIKHVGPQVREMLGITLEDFVAAGNSYDFLMQPLTSIHLDPSVEDLHKAPNDPRYLWIFGAVGLLILVIASINFMNLSTAQATKRAKEVGMKKVLGSTRKALAGQFVAETVLLSLMALVVAILLMELALPAFNNILSLNLTLRTMLSWQRLPLLIGVAVLVGLFAGSYPAFYLSAFQPATVLKGKTSGRQNTKIRMALTVMQFVISIILISGSTIMHRQLNYMMNKDLGFEKEDILVVRRAYMLGSQVDAFKTEMQGVPGVLSVSASTALPGRNNNSSGYILQGREEETFLMQTTWADYDFLETFGMQMGSGRFFDPDLPTDREAIIVNERAVQNMGLDDPFTHRIITPWDERQIHPVIGVINNFHFESLRYDIGAAAIKFKTDDMHWGYVSLRYEASMIARVMAETEEIWKDYTNNEPFLHYFMDEDFNRLFREERQNARLSVIFTILAIVIASMGLYGLTAFSLQQRTREIGIRKTFGASVLSLWLLMCKDVMMLVGIATIVAWPLTYWVAGNWLQNFHYRISMQPTDFLLGFVLAIVIALITISYRVFKTASLNPSMSLRYE